MNKRELRLDLLFDGEEYRRSGACPWTFFAFPTSIADPRGLPPDTDACRLIAELQHSGLDVAIWVNGLAQDTTYFAVRSEDRHRLYDALLELETSARFERDFCAVRSERLFAVAAAAAELRCGHAAADRSDSNG